MQNNLNKEPLRQHIVHVLKNTNQPLSTQELAELILERGYITKSKIFSQVVFMFIKNNKNVS